MSATPSLRSSARLAAVQALYQMDVAGKGIAEVTAEFETHWIGGSIEGEDYLPAELAFFRNIIEGVVHDQQALDVMVDGSLQKGWPLRRIEAVLRAVLRAGAYELKKRKDIPARVIISEYVDVAAAFYEREEAGLANGVLDALAHELRAAEFEKKQA